MQLNEKIITIFTRGSIWDFDYNFELPARTTAMAFSYNGQMGAGAGEGLTEEFWYDPFQ